MKKFAVILSGCGIYDGAEIHEATLTLLAIKKLGAGYQCFAPDISQHHVINHLTGDEMNEKRNVLVESARIARGEIKPLSDFNPKEFDALIFPGGFGVAKNLCTFAFDGFNASVNKEVEKAVKEMLKLKKPIGAMCIAPVLIAKIIGDVNVTIGKDEATAETIEKMGATHITANYDDVVIDDKHNVFTTPYYMEATDIVQVYEGAYNIIEAMLKVMG